LLIIDGKNRDFAMNADKYELLKEFMKVIVNKISGMVIVAS
jgi:hypothetical protein